MRRHNRHGLVGGNTPMVEIFGAAFALLLILFLLVNVFAEAQLRAQVENSIEDSVYKINWEQGAEGYIVLAFPDRLHIIEDKKATAAAQLRDACEASQFADYARRVYDQDNTQLIFAITTGGVTTMRLARDCLKRMWPNRRISIGWIVANEDFLQAVRLEDLPPRLRRSLEDNR